ncbi:MAG: hypothetical protein JF888_06980 [Candidatus Dormibacteraeota bacterium]|uniref:Uncharacterized protein n=1 Tax=Candidatus Dormiibacter inghamiae TaxID=3127013 RepID=A0A934KDR7_9BACT|nr:hypothetical protein [Candidatus Dormibacteraeota bacterium]
MVPGVGTWRGAQTLRGAGHELRVALSAEQTDELVRRRRFHSFTCQWSSNVTRIVTSS